MEQVSQKAGIHRATLDRWENGRVQPYLLELTTLLAVLDASEQEKRKALELMEAPRAAKQIRQEVTQIAEQAGITPMPHGGDLLRAMRMRRELSLEEAARRIQISSATLRRWEKMEVWPSLEQLHRLGYALEAQEEEIVALTVGRFSQQARPENSSLEALEQRLSEMRMAGDMPGGDPLFELAGLQLEADAWPLALRSDAGKQMLIAVYAHHAQSLSSRSRLAEANAIAERALELMTDRLKPEKFWMYPVFVAARARVFRAERPAPKRGLELLRPWRTVAQWPDMHAWMLSEMAKYIGLSGERTTSLTLAEQACRVAERTSNAVEVSLRRWDKASLLLQAERPQEALALLEERGQIEEDLPEARVDVGLLRTKVYLALGDITQAHDWLQRAQRDIDAYHLEFKRPLAEKLAAQIVSPAEKTQPEKAHDDFALTRSMGIRPE